MPVPLVENAPAKVNLTLRVLGQRPDGYHDLESLVAFADFGDRLSFVRGGELSLTVRGPTWSTSAMTKAREELRGGAKYRRYFLCQRYRANLKLCILLPVVLEVSALSSHAK